MENKISFICNMSLEYFKELVPYRLDDAWDWICDNLDLDNNFNKYIEDVCKEIYDLDMVSALTTDVDLKIISKNVAKKLIDEMENSIWLEK